jgi:hypothetical protein
VLTFRALGRNPIALESAPQYRECMIFLLAGGPRDGQLVDEVPTGYEAERTLGGSIEILEGLVAVTARWAGPRPLPRAGGAGAAGVAR